MEKKLTDFAEWIQENKFVCFWEDNGKRFWSPTEEPQSEYSDHQIVALWENNVKDDPFSEYKIEHGRRKPA